MANPDRLRSVAWAVIPCCDTMLVMRTTVWMVIGLAVLFVLYEATNIFGVNWLIHTDDSEYYTYARTLATGSGFDVTSDDPIHFADPVFAPAGTLVLDGVVVPKRSYGMYFLAAAAYAIHPNAVFWFVPIFTLVGVVALAALLRGLTSRTTSLTVTIAYALSFPVVYWSNMLYPNVIALSLMILATYLLLRMVRSVNPPRLAAYLVLAGILALMMWVRYESAAFVVLLLPTVWLFRRNFQWRRLAAASVLLVVLCLPILALNVHFFGSPLSFGYTAPALADEDFSSATVTTQSAAPSFADTVIGIYRRFFGHLLSPNWSIVSRNLSDWVVRLYPLLTALALAGLVALWHAKRERKQVLVLLPILVFAAVWVYNNAGGILWGYRTHSLGTSYIRYFMIGYLAMFLLTAFLLEFIRQRAPRRIAMATVIVVLAVLLGTDASYALRGSYSLVDTVALKREGFASNERAQRFPQDTVFVGSLQGKVIMDRPFLNPDRIPEDRRKETTLQYINQLLRSGRRVILAESPGHATFLDLASTVRASDRFTIVAPTEDPTLQEVRLR
ncbi:MAG: glycosyltransferase family 39 protein [Candidatus Kerfeldbacteria bacterium]|nr:glycosyltransferase family 39 protein [Candidatus Kerfeldbacteria bacterium]